LGDLNRDNVNIDCTAESLQRLKLKAQGSKLKT